MADRLFLPGSGARAQRALAVLTGPLEAVLNLVEQLAAVALLPPPLAQLEGIQSAEAEAEVAEATQHWQPIKPVGLEGPVDLARMGPRLAAVAQAEPPGPTQVPVAQ